MRKIVIQYYILFFFKQLIINDVIEIIPSFILLTEKSYLMKKHCLFLIVGVCFYFHATAQNTFPSSGNVGIGTTTPSQALDVNGSINLAPTTSSSLGVIFINGTMQFLHNYSSTGSDGHNVFLGGSSGNFTMASTTGNSYQASGNVGVGFYTLSNLTMGYDNAAFGVNSLNANTTGFGNLAIGSRSLISNTWGYRNVALGTYSLQQNVGGANNVAIGYGSGENASGASLTALNDCTFIGYRTVSTVDNISNSIAIGSGAQVTQSNEVVIGSPTVTTTVLQGQVGIGTTTPREALSVNGNIRSKQVKVETANWPDYVFDKEYQLLSLNEVQNYIKLNHHLPELPSQEQISKEGLNLGEMNKLLAKKIEEMTLYLIQKDSELRDQQTVLNELKLRNQSMEGRIKNLEDQVQSILKTTNK
ncbi:MAG: hypothetical protein JWP94_2866 [Mucilaginibacter sp.]|nr:hypothetical protein [Mucilaginibacter sp.]